jgi:hypothetical protein
MSVRPASSRRVSLGALTIDPAANPAVTDTGTWDRASAGAAVAGLPVETLRSLDPDAQLPPQPAPDAPTGYPGSTARVHDSSFVLAALPDGQHVLLEYRPDGRQPLLPAPFHDVQGIDGRSIAVHATDADVLHRYTRDIATTKGPRALGDTPRLGIGVRMTTACWPAVFRAQDEKAFAANAIQNSVRELNFLADLRAGRPADRNYASGFGTIEAGYTGSTFEGLWTWGVLEALKYPRDIPFGADADHLQVKRGPDGMARARRYIDSCRYHTFFTIDMADILDYGALTEPSDAAAADRAARLTGAATRRELRALHCASREPGRLTARLPEPMLDRLIGKYWTALDALAEIDRYVQDLRDGEPYDLEFTIDEHPPEIAAFDCLTSAEECRFLLDEFGRRQLPVTHLAPNVGTEKGFDYRGADGLAGLEARVGSLAELIGSRGLLIDIHSADDLVGSTRRALRRATRGRLHYKISPMPQLLFAGVLEDAQPDLFRAWWDDAIMYAREEAAAGSGFASWCLEELAERGEEPPLHRYRVFHHFSFRFVGRRDEHGQFVNREAFYSLSPEFYRVHEERLTAYLAGLADELLS